MPSRLRDMSGHRRKAFLPHPLAAVIYTSKNGNTNIDMPLTTILLALPHSMPIVREDRRLRHARR
jgi:hypothetical protein